LRAGAQEAVDGVGPDDTDATCLSADAGTHRHSQGQTGDSRSRDDGRFFPEAHGAKRHKV